MPRLKKLEIKAIFDEVEKDNRRVGFEMPIGAAVNILLLTLDYLKGIPQGDPRLIGLLELVMNVGEPIFELHPDVFEFAAEVIYDATGAIVIRD